jgi:hypothetical protein
MDAPRVEAEQTARQPVKHEDAGLLQVPVVGVEPPALIDYLRPEQERRLVAIERLEDVQEAEHQQRAKRDRVSEKRRKPLRAAAHASKPGYSPCRRQ